ncbi:hypothetical protein EDM56_19950 [Brevibacillus fluminis]|uniref:Transposase IS110-like N-terminal domain-containing protein n=1 Tax=Brevibacillus fluminis TaxID=511487 RepID=A0A3M8D9L7_9BACL|nr:hypothetical protein EDM56_19950 [Brevibacillus fluminis]
MRSFTHCHLRIYWALPGCCCSVSGGTLYNLHCLNPLISNQAKKASSLRKVKTDAVDAYQLCELYYKEEFEAYKQRGVHFLNLRHLTRQFESLTDMYVQAKLQFHAVLDQVFPEYNGVFGDLFSRISLLLLREFPTAESILTVGESTIMDRVACICTSRSERWAKEKAELIMAAATRNPFQKTAYQSHLISLELYISLLLQYQEHLSSLQDQIDALAKEVEEYEIIQSIPGIGKKSRQRFYLKSEKSIGLLTLRN